MPLLARGKRFGRWTSFWLIAHCGGITQAAKNYGNTVGKESCLNSNPATCQVMFFFFPFSTPRAMLCQFLLLGVLFFWIRHIAFFEATLVIISNWNGNIYCWISGLKIAVCVSVSGGLIQLPVHLKLSAVLHAFFFSPVCVIFITWA